MLNEQGRSLRSDLNGQAALLPAESSGCRVPEQPEETALCPGFQCALVRSPHHPTSPVGGFLLQPMEEADQAEFSEKDERGKSGTSDLDTYRELLLLKP